MMDNDQTPQENPATEVNQEVTVTPEAEAPEAPTTEAPTPEALAEPVAQTSAPAEEVTIVVNEAAIQAIAEENLVQIINNSPILTGFNTNITNIIYKDINSATEANTDLVENNNAATQEEPTSEVGSPSKKRLKI